MFKKITQSIVELFYPNTCYSCNISLLSNEKYICFSCWNSLPKTNFHLQTNNEIVQKFWGKINIQQATALFYFTKDSHLQHLLHALKYQKEKEIGILLGNELGKELQLSQWYSHIDFIIPIPLSKQKLKKRGFNQSEYIAKGISEIIQIPYNNALIERSKNTSTQTQKTLAQRHENVKDAFEIKDKTFFENKNILLIDDVITTGATLLSCSSLFQEIKNCNIYIATIAYAIN